jgi:hypothetical protein
MCRTPLADAVYLRCSVSSCNLGRVKLRFCSEACFAAHIPTARHRRAKAIEMRADDDS